MKQDFPKHLAELFYTPLAISESYLARVDKLTQENISDFSKELKLPEYKKKTVEQLEYNADTRVGIVPVSGLLLDKYDAEMDYWYGITAYESILYDAKVMLEAGASTLAIMADSGGGQAYGMLESASLLRELADSYGAKLVTYVDGTAASAMYGITSVSHEVIANPESEVGSIGVIVSLTDTSKYLADLGISYEFITAGEGKSARNNDGSFTQAFKDDLQAKVNTLYEKFTSHVAKYRNLSQEQVKALGAKVYTTDDAISNGLVDTKMTREEFFTYLADTNKGNTQMLGSLFSKTTNPRKETAMSEKEVDVQAQLDSLKTNLEAEMTSALAKMEADWQAKLEAKDAELNQYRQAIEAQEKEKKEAKAAERVATMAAILGDVKGAEMAASLEALSDEAFASVAATMKTTAKAKEETLQAEVGAQGDVVVTEDVTTSYSETVQKNMQEFLNKQNKKGAK